MILEDSYLRFFVAKMKCASCGQRYSSHSINLVGDFNEFKFYQVTCASCGMQTMITAVVAGEIIPEFIEDTPANREEDDAEKNWSSSSYMLKLGNFMKYFNGDFSHMFTS